MIFVVGAVGAGLAMGVGDYILQILNETGITIPASANYVAPIESLVSSAFPILRIGSRLPDVIQIILALVIATIVTIAALPKLYDNLSA